MRRFFLASCLLLVIGCEIAQDEQPISADIPKKDDVTLNEFLKIPCGTDAVEFEHLYDGPKSIQSDEEEHLILLDSLRSKGYEIIHNGRGNWEKGPRIISYDVTNYFCDCQVDKLYYSPEINGKYKVTERVECHTKIDSLESFVPDGYEIMGKATGDFNNDGIKDIVMVIKRAEEIATEEIRPILVLTGTASGYKLNARNTDFMLSWDGGGVYGDPYEGISLKDGLLTITHYGGSSWRWHQEMNFRFDTLQNEFLADHYINTSYWTFAPDTTTEVDSMNYAEKGLSFSRFVNPYN